MFTNLLQIVPQLSVLAIVLVSIFNIGYFSRIGLHFLGVVDLSNFVYSFGLVFGILTGLLWFFGGDYFERLSQRASQPDALKRAKKFQFLRSPFLLLIVASLFLIPSDILPATLLTDLALVVAFGVLFVSMSSFAYIRFKADGRALSGDVAVALVFLANCVYSLGRAEANLIVFYGAPYTVITRDTSIEHAHLVRTSSLGLIIAIDGKIIFLPKEEIKQVAAERSLEK